MAAASNWRSRLVADLEGDILEIGVGSGDNLPYYRRARHVWAIEPDPAKADKARQRAAQAAIPMTVDVAPAEALPYPDAAFDVVVSSLVFCSVADPIVALRELQRVLRPAGVMHMREHVRPKSNAWAALATTLTPLQRRLFSNCHLDRPTVEILRAQGWHVEVLAQKSVLMSVRATPPQTPHVLRSEALP